jgi:hypothetical protein
MKMGLRWVESGPLVRSSYRAEQQVARLSERSPHDGSGNRQVATGVAAESRVSGPAGTA